MINLLAGGLSVLALAAVAGCAVPPQQREQIGVLGTSGSEVFVNHQRVASGTTIYSNDNVSTGPNSSAIIDFSVGGGFLQLDENTDPVFSWDLVEGVRCIFARILSGQVYVDKAEFCLATPAADVVSGSRINVQVTAQQSVITLLQGSLRGTRPRTPTLAPGQEMIADIRETNARIRSLNRTVSSERVAWLARYRFQGWCQTENQVRPSFRDECNASNFSFAPSQPAAPTTPDVFPQRDRGPVLLPPRRSSPPPPPPPRYRSPG